MEGGEGEGAKQKRGWGGKKGLPDILTFDKKIVSKNFFVLNLIFLLIFEIVLSTFFAVNSAPGSAIWSFPPPPLFFATHLLFP